MVTEWQRSENHCQGKPETDFLTALSVRKLETGDLHPSNLLLCAVKEGLMLTVTCKTRSSWNWVLKYDLQGQTAFVHFPCNLTIQLHNCASYLEYILQIFKISPSAFTSHFTVLILLPPGKVTNLCCLFLFSSLQYQGNDDVIVMEIVGSFFALPHIGI